MASVDRRSKESKTSADIISDCDIPCVRSSLGFTVYYELSGKKFLWLIKHDLRNRIMQKTLLVIK